MRTISTLFLLERTQRESTRGRRFDRLVHSIPLWLQLLAVLVIAWLLAQPRYIQSKSTQRIAIVLDSSASMQVFKDRLPDAIRGEIGRLQGRAANVELWLLESDASQPTLYHGNSSPDLLSSLDPWLPSSGAVNPSDTLRVARSLVGTEGAVSYISDTPPTSQPPYHASSVAIGSNTDNCGITGVSFEEKDGQLVWKAIIRNYASTPQTRSWQLESHDSTSPAQNLQLKPGQLATIRGLFPPGQPRCRIKLSSDTFSPDDTLPLVRPAPKVLNLYINSPANELGKKIQNSFPNIRINTSLTGTDLVLSSNQTTPSEHHLIVAPVDKSTSRPYLTGKLIAKQHPLTQGLNWQTLLARNNYALPHSAQDEVLLWQGKRALIFLRTHPSSNKQALVFNFDIAQSNALKQPAVAVLLLRFCEHIRDSKITPENRITETGQPLKISHDRTASSPPLVLTRHRLDSTPIDSTSASNNSRLHAPTSASFFTVRQGEQTLLHSACHFADTREADFSQCASATQAAGQAASASDRHSRDDHLWRYWVGLLIAALLGSWYYTRSSSRPS